MNPSESLIPLSKNSRPQPHIQTCSSCHPPTSTAETLYHVGLFPVPMRGPLFPGESLHLRVSIVSALHLFSDITSNGLAPQSHEYSKWCNNDNNTILLNRTIAIAYSADSEIGSLAIFKPIAITTNPNSFNLHLVIIGRYKLHSKAHFHRPYPCLLVTLLCDIYIPWHVNEYGIKMNCRSSYNGSCSFRNGDNEQVDDDDVLSIHDGNNSSSINGHIVGYDNDISDTNNHSNDHSNDHRNVARSSKPSSSSKRSLTDDSNVANSPSDCNDHGELDNSNIITSHPNNNKINSLDLQSWTYEYMSFPRSVMRLLNPHRLIKKAIYLTRTASLLEPPAIDPNLLLNAPCNLSCPSQWSYHLCSSLPSDTSPSLLSTLLHETCPITRLIRLIRILNHILHHHFNGILENLTGATGSRKRRKVSVNTTAVIEPQVVGIPSADSDRNERNVDVDVSNDVLESRTGVVILKRGTINHSNVEEVTTIPKESKVIKMATKIIPKKTNKDVGSKKEMKPPLKEVYVWPCSPTKGFQRVNVRYPCKGYFKGG